ncbi:glycosyltransferase family 92 protein [Actibacterium sp.]|uniref:glycosyltransferase family 92 protein n=1 Tax=Actibacterium sp. TaxID=1872125 RepID=UPI00356B526E
MLGALLSRKTISKLAITPPDPVPGRAGVALVLIVVNEGRHIGEWARFHLRAGVSHIYAYHGASTDDTEQQLRAAAGDRLTVIPWDQKLRDALTGREIHNQVLAYAHAIRNYGPKYRWMACIDADEFLIPTKADSIPAALEHLTECPQISLPWHNFGRNGHVEAPEGGVLENYTRRVADPMSGARGVTNFKTVIDPCHVTAIRVHRYEVDGQAVTWNDRGERFAIKDRTGRGFYSTDHLQLNHYYTRSESELAAKIARGSNQTVETGRHAARVRRNVANIEAAEVEDRTALEYLARLSQGAAG